MIWSVPREWEGERAYILCGGASLQEYRRYIPYLDGRIIAIKQTVYLRPDADVMFLAGRDDAWVCEPFFSMHTGQYKVGRHPHLEYDMVRNDILCTTRLEDPSHASHDPRFLGGLDAGTSAMNLAYLFGSDEIVMLGYDMKGGRWLNGELPHHLPYPPQAHHDRHLPVARQVTAEIERMGCRVISCSRNSAADFIPFIPLEDVLRCGSGIGLQAGGGPSH